MEPSYIHLRKILSVNGFDDSFMLKEGIDLTSFSPFEERVLNVAERNAKKYQRSPGLQNDVSKRLLYLINQSYGFNMVVGMIAAYAPKKGKLSQMSDAEEILYPDQVEASIDSWNREIGSLESSVA